MTLVMILLVCVGTGGSHFQGRDVRFVQEINRRVDGRIIRRIGQQIGWGAIFLGRMIEQSIECALYGLQLRHRVPVRRLERAVLGPWFKN